MDTEIPEFCPKCDSQMEYHHAGTVVVVTTANGVENVSEIDLEQVVLCPEDGYYIPIRKRDSVVAEAAVRQNMIRDIGRPSCLVGECEHQGNKQEVLDHMSEEHDFHIIERGVEGQVSQSIRDAANAIIDAAIVSFDSLFESRKKPKRK